MAIYHCSIKIVSRGKGKSAVAAAAYRAGEKITNEYDGITHDYTRKGGVTHTEILLPDHAPREYTNRSILWNAVEKIEKAKNSQLAREIELALPVELSVEQNISLARDYVQCNFVDAGMCADICIHDKNDGNPHAHVLLTMRPFNEDKTWGDKQRKEYILDKNGDKTYDKNKRQYKCKSVPTTDWNEQTKADYWRAAWADSMNTALEQNEHAERVDHRSYERQVIELIPTVHMGVAASQMEQRGIVTERGNQNREIRVHNNLLRQIMAKLKQFKDWLKEAIAPTVHNKSEEKPSIMEQIDKYKKEIKESKNAEPLTQSALSELHARLDRARQSVLHLDMLRKRTRDPEEWDKLLGERRNAYNEYSALKAEVKKAEASLPNKKLWSRDLER